MSHATLLFCQVEGALLNVNEKAGYEHASRVLAPALGNATHAIRTDLLQQHDDIEYGIGNAREEVVALFQKFVQPERLPEAAAVSRCAAFMRCIQKRRPRLANNLGQFLSRAVAAEHEYWRAVALHTLLHSDVHDLLAIAANKTVVQPITHADVRVCTAHGRYSPRKSIRLKLDHVGRLLNSARCKRLTIFEEYGSTSPHGWDRYAREYSREQLRGAAIIGGRMALATGIAMQMKTRIFLDRANDCEQLPRHATHLVRSLKAVPEILGL